MNLSAWVYLGVGILLGIGFSWLFKRLTKTPSISLPIVSPESELLPSVSQQIKQTQLAYQMAQEMSQFKAGFLARTTHELRSPLNGLIGLHQLILSDLCENPAEEREFVAQAHERALKLHKLFDEILNIARTEYGTNKLEIQPLPLANILQEVDQLTYMLAANRNLPLRVSLPSPEIYVLADPRWLRQVLINLVDNTIVNMEEGTIYLSSSIAPTNNSVHVWLDAPTSSIGWSEPIDLITSVNSSHPENLTMSPGMKLLLNQTLLEVMGGKLDILTSPPDIETHEQMSRLQITIPIVIPENELLHLVEN